MSYTKEQLLAMLVAKRKEIADTASAPGPIPTYPKGGVYETGPEYIIVTEDAEFEVIETIIKPPQQ